jgi:hypothetical protein
MPKKASSPPVVPKKASSPPVVLKKASSPPVVPKKTSSPPVVPKKASSPPVVPKKASSPPVVPKKAGGPPVVPKKASGPPVVPKKAANALAVPKRISSPPAVPSKPSSPKKVWVRGDDGRPTVALERTETGMRPAGLPGPGLGLPARVDLGVPPCSPARAAAVLELTGPRLAVVAARREPDALTDESGGGAESESSDDLPLLERPAGLPGGAIRSSAERERASGLARQQRETRQREAETAAAEIERQQFTLSQSLAKQQAQATLREAETAAAEIERQQSALSRSLAKQQAQATLQDAQATHQAGLLAAAASQQPAWQAQLVEAGAVPAER